MSSVFNEISVCPMNSFATLPVVTFMLFFGTPLVFASLAANAID